MAEGGRWERWEGRGGVVSVEMRVRAHIPYYLPYLNFEHRTPKRYSFIKNYS